MKKWTCFVILALAASAEAHSGDRVYPIYELTDEMLAKIDLRDGSVQEWADLLGEPSMTLLDFAYVYINRSLDPSDLDFRIWLAWHDDPDRLYLAYVCSDDVYKNTHDYSADGSIQWIDQHDSIVLVVDADHSGGKGIFNNTILEEGERIAGQTQVYEAIARTASGPILNDSALQYQTGDFGWSVFPPYGDAGGGVFGENPTISVIELFISPYDDWDGFHGSPDEGVVFSDLSAGRTIGFGIVVYDIDDHPRYLTPEAVQTEDPLIDLERWRADFYLDGLLLPADPSEAAVESDTWGRIKASFE